MTPSRSHHVMMLYVKERLRISFENYCVLTALHTKGRLTWLSYLSAQPLFTILKAIFINFLLIISQFCV